MDFFDLIKNQIGVDFLYQGVELGKDLFILKERQRKYNNFFAKLIHKKRENKLKKEVLFFLRKVDLFRYNVYTYQQYPQTLIEYYRQWAKGRKYFDVWLPHFYFFVAKKYLPPKVFPTMFYTKNKNHIFDIITEIYEETFLHSLYKFVNRSPIAEVPIEGVIFSEQINNEKLLSTLRYIKDIVYEGIRTTKISKEIDLSCFIKTENCASSGYELIFFLESDNLTDKPHHSHKDLNTIITELKNLINLWYNYEVKIK